MPKKSIPYYLIHANYDGEVNISRINKKGIIKIIKNMINKEEEVPAIVDPDKNWVLNYNIEERISDNSPEPMKNNIIMIIKGGKIIKPEISPSAYKYNVELE